MRLLFCFLFLMAFQSFLKAQSVDPHSPEYQVFIFLSDECLISQYYVQTLDSIHEHYSSDSIEFLGVFPNESTSVADIDTFKQIFGLEFTMIKDEEQSITRKWGATVTPEVIVAKMKDESILYKGRIDDAYFRVGKKRTVKTTSELRDVLFSLKNNQPIHTQSQQAIGCFIQGL